MGSLAKIRVGSAVAVSFVPRSRCKHGECIIVSCTINRIINDFTFDQINTRFRAALADRSLGVLPKIEAKATMKNKLNVETPAYHIPGACKPRMAYQANRFEPRIGAMMPCNVILRETGVRVLVSAT